MCSLEKRVPHNTVATQCQKSRLLGNKSHQGQINCESKAITETKRETEREILVEGVEGVKKRARERGRLSGFPPECHYVSGLVIVSCLLNSLTWSWTGAFRSVPWAGYIVC